MNCTYPNHHIFSDIKQENSFAGWDVTISNSILPGINWTVCGPCVDHLVLNLLNSDIKMILKGIPD